jgi:hypothetical protein
MRLAKLTPSLLLAAIAATAGGFGGYAIASQPHMESALAHLDSAESELQQATADKGGHRQRALDLVHRAQKEVREGIRFDRKH